MAKKLCVQTRLLLAICKEGERGWTCVFAKTSSHLHPCNTARTQTVLFNNTRPALQQKSSCRDSPLRWLFGVSPAALTRAWQGDIFAHLLVFLRYLPKLSTGHRQMFNTLRPSIGYILTKGKLARFDTSAKNDVRVTSCFLSFGQKQGFAGNAVTQIAYKIEATGFEERVENESFSQTAISNFKSVENFEK